MQLHQSRLLALRRPAAEAQAEHADHSLGVGHARLMLDASRQGLGHFQEGFVVTVEPGIYIPEEGFGVRLENDVVVRKGGTEDLCASIPIEAEEVEDLMHAR